MTMRLPILWVAMLAACPNPTAPSPPDTEAAEGTEPAPPDVSVEPPNPAPTAAEVMAELGSVLDALARILACAEVEQPNGLQLFRDVLQRCDATMVAPIIDGAEPGPCLDALAAVECEATAEAALPLACVPYLWAWGLLYAGDESLLAELPGEGESCSWACGGGLLCLYPANRSAQPQCAPVPEPVGEAEPCALVADFQLSTCRAGLGCSTTSGTCVVPLPDGQPCQDDEQCSSRLCSAELCGGPDRDAPCDDSRDICRGDLVCRDGQCSARGTAGTACTWQPDCAESLICWNEACAEPRQQGETCDDFLDCSGLDVCFSGACAAPIENGAGCVSEDQASQCGRDALCLNGTCRASAELMAQAGPGCAHNEVGAVCSDNCIDGAYCALSGDSWVYGICTSVQPDGTPCDDHVQCAGLLCWDGLCDVLHEENEACHNYEECAAPLACENGICVTGLGEGDVCHSRGSPDYRPCGPGLLCFTGTCVEERQLVVDIRNAQGAVGDVCESDTCQAENYCVPASDEFDVGFCATRLGEGEECEWSLQCVDGHSCWDGHCQARLGEAAPCAGRSDCQDGLTCFGGQCAPALEIGTACTVVDDESRCAAAFSLCFDGACIDVSDLWDLIYAADGAPGDPCNYYSCQSDNYCDQASERDYGHCQLRVGATAACETSAACVDGLACFGGQCIPTLENGANCTIEDSQSACLPESLCFNDRCVDSWDLEYRILSTPGAVGDPCALYLGDTCQPQNYCDQAFEWGAGHCQARITEGQACPVLPYGSACAEALECLDGVCG